MSQLRVSRGSRLSNSALHLLFVYFESLGREGCLHSGLLAVVKCVVDDARHQRGLPYPSWNGKLSHVNVSTVLIEIGSRRIVHFKGCSLRLSRDGV